ncbi:phage tail protein [Salinicoccus roseus]|uniref:phage tail protein n=1 Tax=Salinicoccus roseus TaxID=45670 RepID=UPI0023015208|nr:phage tail protein [Salinicoccus roseus]
MNADFLADLGTRWGVEFDKERYTLINPSVEAIVQQKSVSAVLQFFIDLGGHYLQDEAENESRTALNAYTELFQGTGYTVHLVDSFLANTLSYQKNMSKTERFHYYNERYGAEFIVSGPNVYLYQKIGSHRPEVRIDEDLNVKDATVDIDDANFFTWCKCYYDKVDYTEGGAEEYRHEVVYADQGLIDQYGEIEGPAIYQGSIKEESVMLDYAKKVQEESIKVSHSVTLTDLRRQGYDEFIFRAGDTVRLSLSSVNTTVDIRIMEIDETFDAQGELMGLSLTLGNFDPVKTYKSNRNAALMTVEDWMRGRKTIPNNMLEDAINRAADIVTGDTDSVMEYRKDRLIGHHDKNAGNNVQLNVSGLVYYRNSVPKTAITYEGVTADAITTGILNTQNVLIQGTNGRMTLDGDVFTMRNYNGSRSTVIEPGRLQMNESEFELGGGADIHLTDVGNRLYYSRLDTEMNITRTAGMGVGRSINDRLPYVFMGTTGTGRSGFHPMDDKYFTGFIANTSRRIVDDGIGNSVVGDIFHVRDKAVNFSRGFLFDLSRSRKTIMPMNTGIYTYDLGADNNYFDRAYINSVWSSGNLEVRNQYDTLQGYVISTGYGSSSFINLLGLNAGPYWSNPRYYALGSDTNRFSQIYLLNQPNVSSDERLKTDITYNKLGLDFIRDINTIRFRMDFHMPENHLKYGVSAQNLLGVMKKHGVDMIDQSIVNTDSAGMYGVEYTQLIAPLIKGEQELYQEIKDLKARIKKLEGTE